MRTDETEGERFELALERLRAGDAIVVQGVGYLLDRGGAIEVMAYSAWSPENLDEALARVEIERAELHFERLCDEFDSFREIVERSPEVRFLLVWDDGGGCVQLAELRDERLIWSSGWGHP